MRVLIYTGKGGVGKTSIAAATAVHIAASGRNVLVMSTDQAHSLADSLNITLGFEPKAVSEHLWALEIDPVAESAKAWGNLRDYLKQIIVDKANGGIAADEVLLFPGLDELFSLLKVLDAYESNLYDVIIIDCAPTGETLSLLSYPERLSNLSNRLLPSVRNMNNILGGLISKKTQVPKPRDIVFEEFDKLVNRLTQLQKILKDRSLSSMRIVMTPEQIVIDEARRSYSWINEYDFGVDAVYINKIYPKEAMQGYFSEWGIVQNNNLELASKSFGNCKCFTLELQSNELCGITVLEQAAHILYGSLDPVDVYCSDRAFRMEDENGSRFLILHLPFVSENEINVSKDGENLNLIVRNQTRCFRLPDKVSRRKLTTWTYHDDELRIQFDYD